MDQRRVWSVDFGSKSNKCDNYANLPSRCKSNQNFAFPKVSLLSLLVDILFLALSIYCSVYTEQLDSVCDALCIVAWCHIHREHCGHLCAEVEFECEENEKSLRGGAPGRPSPGQVSDQVPQICLSFVACDCGKPQFNRNWTAIWSDMSRCAKRQINFAPEGLSRFQRPLKPRGMFRQENFTSLSGSFKKHTE